MNKRSFLSTLKARLSSLPRKELSERLNFYSEMIDDRMEEGLSETDAVRAVGSIDEIAEEIIGARRSEKIERAKIKSSESLKGWELALLIIGSPLWVALLIVALAVAFSVYAVIWALILALWAVELPFFIFSYISKYLFIGCVKASEFSLELTKGGLSFIKKTFSGKGRYR